MKHITPTEVARRSTEIKELFAAFEYEQAEAEQRELYKDVLKFYASQGMNLAKIALR